MIYEILVGAQRAHVNSALSYKSDVSLEVGQVVLVPLRDQFVLGTVVRVSTDFPKKTKDIQQIFPYALSKIQLDLINWLAAYYPAPLSAIVQLFLPSLSIAKLAAADTNAAAAIKPKLPALTSDQTHAVEQITNGASTNYLLHGVTGSGKTRVYAELTHGMLTSGKSVIVLTPEIGLTTPLVEYFETTFGKQAVTCFHSQLSPKDRAAAWARVAQAATPQIIIGPRSALFLPVKNLGLIVVDEAHDAAYKQEQQPFYQATRVAAKLASLAGAKCVLGSATPPVGDYYAFAQKSLPIIRLENTAIKSDFIRQDVIVDLRDRSLFQRSQLLSTPLLSAMEEAVKNKRQTLLFLNRRGSARTVLCQNCGWQELCPRCDIALTYHADKNTVLCHVCAFQKPVPMQCPECKATDILFQTPGTKSIEAEVQRLFPEANVARFDKDSATGSKLHQSFNDIQSGKIDILVGTQLLAKGLDLPRLSVIGLVQADSSMVIPDFSATERTFQQISQVAGRLGRGHGDGKLFVQTYHPERPLLKWALEQDYANFYASELKERLQYHFPPSEYLLVIQVKRATQKGAISAIGRIAKSLEHIKSVQVGSPAPSFHEKRAGSYYWQIVIRAKDRRHLTAIIATLPSQTMYNIDPTDLL